MIYYLTIPGQRIEIIRASSAHEWLKIMREGSLMESKLTDKEYLKSYIRGLVMYLGDDSYGSITSAYELTEKLSEDGFLLVGKDVYN